MQATQLPVKSDAEKAPADPCVPAGLPGRDGWTYTIELVSDPTQLDARQDAWQQLAEITVDPNPFYEPWFFLPAIQHLSQNEQWRILLVQRRHDKKPEAPELCGFFPFVAEQGPGWLTRWTLWQNPFCFLTSPLIHRLHAAAVWDVVFKYLHDIRPAVSCMEFPLLSGEGPVHHSLTEISREHLSTAFISDQYLRATTYCPTDVEAYFKNALGGHHVREYRRKRRKLEGLGQLEYRQTNDSRGVGCWLDWFLDLEAQGWKARAGTAIKQHPHEAAFFREMVQTGFSENRVRLEGLFLDGEPIALKCILFALPVAFAFKIAFDEAHHSCSPGVQLEFDSLKHLAETPGVSSCDSCAVPGHQMIDRLWTERRLIRKLLISTGHAGSDIVVGSLPLFRAIKRSGKRWINSIRKKLSGNPEQ